MVTTLRSTNRAEAISGMLAVMSAPVGSPRKAGEVLSELTSDKAVPGNNPMTIPAAPLLPAPPHAGADGFAFRAHHARPICISPVQSSALVIVPAAHCEPVNSVLAHVAYGPVNGVSVEITIPAGDMRACPKPAISGWATLP